jgi:lipopolysaccharide transport system ATP-binding protein
VAGLRAPSERLSSFVRRLSSNGDKRPRTNDETIWALKNVSFEVQRGEVLGIIGRNGAGKSTLLKILSRITEPTEGRVEIHGRVGSLLEVGTGFHPELTGRENIYLNGAILGMRKTEIDNKFDEIVAFAEIEKFLDTPVKRYSSGMYVRLAFAVAAHLEPEILVVDEVLAVGDAAFQKKCLGRMDYVAKEGRTVLFVSHNMSAVQRLCSKGVMLDRGQLVAHGSSADIVARYLSAGVYNASPATWIDLSRMSRKGSREAYFLAVSYSSFNETFELQPYSNGPLEFSLAIMSDSPRSVGSIAVTLYDQYGTKLVNADTLAIGRTIKLRKGRNELKLKIEKLHLNSGTYMLGLWMADPIGGVLDNIDSALTIQVVTPESEGYGVKPDFDGAVTCRFDVLDLE